MEYVVGIDGGGTKTAGRLVDLNGRVVARAAGGPTNYQIVGAEGVRREIPRLVEDLFAAAGLEKQQLASIVLGLAGVGRPGEPERVARLIGNLQLARKVVVDNDAMIALVGALGDQPGLILIAGTGSIALGTNERGQRVRVGGWGYLLGDEGSGFFIARAALSAVMRAYDGRERQTVLTEKLVEALGLSDPQEIIPRVYGKQMSHTEMAELAPAVFQAAREEDPVATGIIRSAGRELGLMAAAAIRKLELTGRVKIGLVGSLFKSRDLLQDAIAEALGDDIQAEFISPRMDPAAGAVLVALKEAGVELTEEIMARLEGRSGCS
jgi:N-acetylglucosamine kinase-like BadF-type ATPase